MKKENPWEHIALQEYESHMGLKSVKQLQGLNESMARQLNSYPVSSVMILGVAGGNGLEHVRSNQFEKVYGVDVNAKYLKACRKRYAYLGETLVTIHADLQNPETILPSAKLLIANLLIEYIGYENFKRAVKQTDATYVSCVIQKNEEESFVSESEYLHTFDNLSEVHREIDEEGLNEVMQQMGYHNVKTIRMDMPNGKQLIQLDYKK